MGPAIVRSSLEVMLDALRQKDDKPKDTIPALPVRPVSRGRLPSSRRPLQANFNIENNEIGNISKKEVGSQEESVDHNIQVICIQKHVRGVKARRDFQELRKGAIPLQSFIRGSLARKHFDNVRSLNVSEKNSVKLMDTYQEQLREAQETVQELQDRVLKAEAALKDKDEENNTLKQQIQQYESKWSEYDMKMKSMEETWSHRLTSLQISLAEAKRSIAANEKLQNQQASHNSTPINNRYCDSEDTSQEFQTPDTTPAKQTRTYAALLLVNSNNNNNNGPQSAVNDMVKEFENKTKEFDDEARTIVEVKPGNPDEEVHRLKLRFKKWKRDYKNKLREMKAELHKHGSAADSLKIRRKWWSLWGAK